MQIISCKIWNERAFGEKQTIVNQITCDNTFFLNVIFFHKNAERFKVLLRFWEYDQGYKISLFVFYDKLFEDSLDVKANIGRFIEQCLLKRVIEKEISLIINVYVIH